MFARVVLIGASVLSAACDATNVTTNSPTPSPVKTEVVSPSATVAGLSAEPVRLLLPGSATSPCYGNDPAALFQRSRGCPVTDRLQQRLNSDAARGFNPVCRCQAAIPAEVGEAAVTGATAIVPVTFRTPTPYLITFVLVQQGQDWLVDDVYCGSDQSTTVYATPIETCG
jgi:hypothetical protein